MPQELTDLADAVYNGLCLAAENGHTDAWAPSDVTPPGFTGEGTFTLNVVLTDGRTAVVLVNL